MTDETKATPWTPGLWYVRYFPGNADPSVYAKTRTHKVPICIARVYGREGDARLIAAAPEMAEALEQARAAFATISNQDDGFGDEASLRLVLAALRSFAGEHFEKARAALAKARGEVKP